MRCFALRLSRVFCGMKQRLVKALKAQQRPMASGNKIMKIREFILRSSNVSASAPIQSWRAGGL